MSKLAFDILTKYQDQGVKKAGKGFQELGDKAEKGAKGAGKSFDQLGTKAGKAGSDSGKNFGVGFSRSLGPLGGRVSGFFKTSAGKAIGVLGGATLGAGLAAGFTDALAQGDINAKLKSQLDLSAKDSQRLGKIAGDLYKSNYGESVGEVSAVMRKVVQDTNTSVKSINLKPITAQVLSISNTFDQEFGQVTRAAGQLLRTGLAKNMNQALDVITKGFQEGADKSEDFLDTLNEYGTLFRNMGLSGAQATGILTQGLRAGARDADKVADAIKEFSIRAVDGTDATADGFKMLGLNADDMAKKIGKGGGSASKALDTVLDRLRFMKDPVERSRAATALFGTTAEDLGKALFSIDPSGAVASLGKVEGAAAKVDKTVGGTANATLQGFMRSVKQNLVEGMGAAITAFQDGKTGADGWIGKMQEVGSAMRRVWEVVKDVAGVIGELPGPIKSAGVALGAFLLIRSKMAAFGSSIRTNIIDPLRTAKGGGGIGGLKSAATGLLGFFGGPWGVGLALAGGLLGILAGKFFDAKGKVDELTEALKSDSGAIRENTREVLIKQIADSGLIGLARAAKIPLDQVTAAVMGQTGAHSALTDKLKSVDAKLQNLRNTQAGGGGLTAAQDANRKSLLEQRDAILGVIDKTNNLSGDLKNAKKKYNDYEAATRAAKKATDDETEAKKRGRAALKKQLEALGLNKAEVKRYTKALKDIPPKQRTAILADLKQARDALNRFVKKYDGKALTFHADMKSWLSKNRGLLPGFRATGGHIRGPGTGTSDSIPAWLSNGEFVIRASQTAKHRPLLEAINSGRTPAFAGGGPVKLKAKAKTATAGMDVERLFARLVAASAGGGKALSWARSQAGKPYGWGHAGPGSYDCSGFMSAIVNVIKGRYPYSRLGSTATFPWGGFAPGPGRFMIGSTRNAGNGIGHMAGTLGGTNVESRGGDGVVVGGSARGARSGLFGGNVWHLRGFAQGGPVQRRAGDPPFDLLDPKGKHARFDNGGLLMSGGVGFNGTRTPERVLSPRQTAAFEKLVASITSPRETASMFQPLISQIQALSGRLASLTSTLEGASRGAASSSATTRLQSQRPTSKQRAAAQILRHIKGGGRIFEDLSFRGDSALVGRFNDTLADEFYGSGGKFNRKSMIRYLGRVSQPAARPIRLRPDDLRGNVTYQVTVNVTHPLASKTDIQRLFKRTLDDLGRQGALPHQR